jgi:hypothetical protein
MPDDDDGSNSLPDPQQPTSRADKLARVSEVIKKLPSYRPDQPFHERMGHGYRTGPDLLRLAAPLPRSVLDANRSVITNSPWIRLPLLHAR